MIIDKLIESKIKTYAFVGPSGTGKSYRAQMVASERGISYIIDDGLLIKENEVIAGVSAKKAATKIETVKKALSEMKNETFYNNLANEGFARTYIDWLYGVNLTRFATLKTGTLLRVGRVIVPIVKAIYDRDIAIKNFVADIYYGITSKEETNGEIVELNSKQKFDKKDKEKAIQLCKEYNSLEAIVKDKKQKKDTLSPGKLYSLSKLQNVLGKKYKMSMDKSLSIVQKLYEEGYLTYPRTNSE